MSLNFNLRGLSPEIMLILKQKAKKEHISVNTLVLKILEQGLGCSRKRHVYHDLDHLAGTWSAEDVKEFNENTQAFEQIDKELWL